MRHPVTAESGSETTRCFSKGERMPRPSRRFAWHASRAAGSAAFLPRVRGIAQPRAVVL